MSLAVVLGVRPHYVKAVALTELLSQAQIDFRLLDVQQHFDQGLRQQFIAEYGLNVVELNPNAVAGASPAQELARQISALDQWLNSTPQGPTTQGLLVLGDANPALAGAIVANRHALPLVHLEAGVRRTGVEFEHWNSLLTDMMATQRYCYTQRDVERLRQEGLGNQSWCVGDVCASWLLRMVAKIPAPSQASPPYVLVTLHRPQNCSVDTVTTISHALDALSYRQIWIVHPRLRPFVHDLSDRNQITLLDPQTHSALLRLLVGAALVLTDSGGLVRESVILGKRAIVCHENGMWTQLVELNAIARADNTLASLSQAINSALTTIDPLRGASVFILPGGEALFKERLVALLEGNGGG